MSLFRRAAAFLGLAGVLSSSKGEFRHFPPTMPDKLGSYDPGGQKKFRRTQRISPVAKKKRKHRMRTQRRSRKINYAKQRI